MIRVDCNRCKSELNEPGAIVLGPPSFTSSVEKLHLCTGCYRELKSWLSLDQIEF